MGGVQVWEGSECGRGASVEGVRVQGGVSVGGL